MGSAADHENDLMLVTSVPAALRAWRAAEVGVLVPLESAAAPHREPFGASNKIPKLAHLGPPGCDFSISEHVRKRLGNVQRASGDRCLEADQSPDLTSANQISLCHPDLSPDQSARDHV